jgi:hypothetical protein
MNKLTTNSFLIEDAIKYGAEEAIFLYNIRYWVSTNEAKESDFHFKEGRYWTYMSQKGFTKWFPFWSEKQIARIVKNLEDAGAILTGKFNKLPSDKTTWYSLSDKEKASSQTGAASSQTGGPLPDSTTDTLYNKKEDLKNDEEADVDNLDSWGERIFRLINSPEVNSTEQDYLKSFARYSSYEKLSRKQKKIVDDIETRLERVSAIDKVPQRSAPTVVEEEDQGALLDEYYRKLGEGNKS